MSGRHPDRVWGVGLSSTRCLRRRLSVRNSPLRDGAQGFSLLEVLVAVTILGIAFVTLFQGFSTGLGLAARASTRSWAVIYARSVMDETLSQDPLEEGSDSGRIDDTYSYRSSIVRIEPGEDEQAVSFDVTVQVSWGSTGYVELRAGKTVNEELQEQ